MPSASARKRNRAALTGEGGRRGGVRSEAPPQRRRLPQLPALLTVLLFTTLALVGFQLYRLQAKGRLPFGLPTPGLSKALEQRSAGLQQRLASLSSIISGDAGEDDTLAYDSAQWKARVAKAKKSAAAKVPLSKAPSAADQLRRAKDQLVHLREDIADVKDGALPTEDLTIEEIQAMFDALQSRGAYDEADDDADASARKGGDDAASTDSRAERFGRLKAAMGVAGAGAEEL